MPSNSYSHSEHENSTPFWKSTPMIVSVALIAVAFCLWSIFQVVRDQQERADPLRANWSKVEKMAREKGIDPRKDPILSPTYYKMHPNEKRPEGSLKAGDFNPSTKAAPVPISR